jgi:hypothetical protein
MFSSRNYKIGIAEPCHEDWDRMKPAAKGRFCDSCAKSVIDFTGMTEKQIAAFFKNRPQNICGRFHTSQIDRTYTTGLQVRLPVHRRFWSFLISLFFSGAIVDKARAQADTITVQHDSLTTAIPDDSIPADSTALVKADSLPAPDTLAVENKTIDLLYEFTMGTCTMPPVDSNYIWGYSVTTVTGLTAVPPDETPSIVKACVKKLAGALNIFKRPATAPEITADSQPHKKPLKKEPVISDAIMPEEVKQQSRKRG